MTPKHTHANLRDRFASHGFSTTSSNEWYGTKDTTDRNRTEVRDAFIIDETMADPAIEYSRVHTIPYTELEQEYLQLLDAAQQDSDDVVYELVARKLAEMYRHKEVSRRLAGDAIDQTLSLRRAEYMNEEIFGEVEQRDFDATFSRVYDKARGVVDTLPEARELIQLIGDRVEVEATDFDFELQPETLERLRGDLFELLPGLEGVLAPAETREVGAEEAALWAQKIIDVTGMSHEGWEAVVGTGKAASTSKKDKRVRYGDERVFASTTKMNETNVHEVIGHAYRSYNASHQDDPQKRGAMPGSLDAEEGSATVLEQIISGTPRQAGQRYLLALGFGKGIDRGGEPRNFRETYEVLYRTLMVDQVTKGESIDRLAAQRKAYQECMRTRRGGAIDARDISYFQGAKKVNPWFNHIARLPDEQRKKHLEILLSGQFDPTDNKHAALFGLESAD